ANFGASTVKLSLAPGEAMSSCAEERGRAQQMRLIEGREPMGGFEPSACCLRNFGRCCLSFTPGAPTVRLHSYRLEKFLEAGSRTAARVGRPFVRCTAGRRGRCSSWCDSRAGLWADSDPA